MKTKTEPELMHLAAAYCSTAERCMSDVRKKIAPFQPTLEMETRILARLTKDKFIDEARYASSFVKDKHRFNHWGRKRISYELHKKGIAASLIQDALISIDDDAYQSELLELLKNKKQSTKGRSEQDVFQKLLRFGLSRGFEGELTIRCLKKLFKEIPDVDI